MAVSLLVLASPTALRQMDIRRESALPARNEGYMRHSNSMSSADTETRGHCERKSRVSVAQRSRPLSAALP
ncbi:hypothetical protein BC629DRAFT_229175 [Irpex lacteus]|nr:hypothetical protein BC629DRAFT_229175 [Irpex lacteus]